MNKVIAEILKKLTEQVLERDRENSLFWWNGSSG
jgi:hypothetical protein